jgi:hypothetical protein
MRDRLFILYSRFAGQALYPLFPLCGTGSLSFIPALRDRLFILYSRFAGQALYPLSFILYPFLTLPLNFF